MKHFSHIVTKIEIFFLLCRKKKWNIFRILLKIIKHFSGFVEKIERLLAYCQNKFQ